MNYHYIIDEGNHQEGVQVKRMSADLLSPFDQSVKTLNDYTNQRLQVLVRHSISTKCT